MATTKNLELYFQHAPVADLTALAAVNTVGIVNGVIIEVAAAGLFEFQIPAIATPDGRDVIAGSGGGVWIRQTLPELTTTAGGAIAIGSGGTSALTQQTAINSLTGTQTNKYYLRSDGTNASLSALGASDLSGTVALANGGTSANLTANNGGIFYSTASAGAILNGTSTADQVLLSGSSTTPAWSTATYPASTTANQLLYSSATNTIGGLTTHDSGVLVTSELGVPSILTAGTTGQFLAASTSGTPGWSTATYPQTTAINKILYSSAANVVDQLATADSAVLVTDSGGIPSLSTTLPAVAAGSCTCTDPTTSSTASIDTALSNVLSAVPAEATNLVGGDANYIPYQTATDTTDFITANASAVLVTDGSNVPSLSTTLPAVAAGACTCTDPTTSSTASIDTALSNVLGAEPPLAVAATNVDGGSANYIPYQTAASTTSFISSSDNAVLASNGSGVPSMVTTLPAVAIDSCIVTDPTTSSSASIDTALSNVYSAIVPPQESAANASSVSLSVAVSTPQIITGAEVILPPGKYLLSYSSSQTFTPTATNIGTAFSATTFIYNTTAAANIAHTSFIALSGDAVTGSEIFGGTASANVVATFAVTTTLDIYTQLNTAAIAGATFVADNTTITAIRLANTQASYGANGTLAADSTSTSPQFVTGAQLVLPAGNYLLTYSASQNLITQVGDASTAFVAKSYIYDTTGAVIVTNTEYTSFSGFATTGSEIFGGTASATVAVTFGVTTTLDVYVQLSAASAGTDTYSIVSEITAVKLD